TPEPPAGTGVDAAQPPAADAAPAPESHAPAPAPAAPVQVPPPPPAKKAAPAEPDEVEEIATNPPLLRRRPSPSERARKSHTTVVYERSKRHQPNARLGTLLLINPPTSSLPGLR
ncbi:MAG: hypothetical protein OXT09_14865, partial [Myxococcales bacterium]|nr:hypothetical protein [Myxococcales bacterium]